MSIIRLEKVSVEFGGHQVLQEVSFEVQARQSLVFVGPSGQGKSTLLKTMCGLVSPQNGRVFFKQEDLSKVSGSARKNLLQDMGILFQKNALFDSLTCFENICFPLREKGQVSEAEIAEIAAYFLEQVGISHAKDLYPDEISGGMQKRLGIARALALKPEIIFYDDPTAGLDPITSRKIVELILRLKEEYGSTIFTVTNDMNRAYQLADRIFFVADREVLETGSVEQTKTTSEPRVQQFIQGLAQGPLTSLEMQC